MKLLLFATISLTALPLFAAEAQKTTAEAQPQPATTTTAAPATTTTAPAPAPVVDSPLVRAAKASAAKKNKKKATIVITNDNLKKAGPSGDGFTTTKSQAPLPPLPPETSLTPEQLAAERNRKELEAKAAEAKAAKEKAAHEAKLAHAAAAVEGDDDPESLYDDPAVVEHRADDASKPKQDQKPPL